MSYDRIALFQELEREEGLRLKPYKCTAGKLTIGVGRNLDDVGITEAEARSLLANDVDRVEKGLDASLPWWRTQTDKRQRALCQMAFQLGLSGLLKFAKMLGAMQAGDYEEAAAQALDSRWARQTPARAARVAEMIRKG